ncbi:thiamine pyrophosphate-dependent acetolactate synthase large subunit-like protein [Paraburkholderia sp. EB58]
MSSENRRAPRNGAELVVQTLEDRGVKYVFGIPGAKIDAVFDTLVYLTIQTVV